MDVINIQDIKDEDTRVVKENLLKLLDHLKDRVEKNELRSLLVVGMVHNGEILKGRSGEWFKDLYIHVGMLESLKAWIMEEEEHESKI